MLSFIIDEHLSTVDGFGGDGDGLGWCRPVVAGQDKPRIPLQPVSRASIAGTGLQYRRELNYDRRIVIRRSEKESVQRRMRFEVVSGVRG